MFAGESIDAIVRNSTHGRFAVMHAAAVEVLIEKSKFEPHVALGIAEAIDMAIESAQLVTVPLLDVRLGALEQRLTEKLEARAGSLEARIGRLETKMEGIKAELVRWVFLVMLGNVAITAGISAILNALQR